MQLLYIAFAVLSAAIAQHIFVLLAEKSKNLQKIKLLEAEKGLKRPAYQLPWDVLHIVKTALANYHLIRGTLIPNMTSLFKRYGPTYKTSVLGQPLIMTMDPSNIRHVLVTRFEDFDTANGLRTHLFAPLTGRGIFGLDGAEWKRDRPMYRDLFSRTRLVFDCEAHEELWQDLKANIPANGNEFDLQIHLPKLLIDFSTEWTVGDRNNALANRQTPAGKQLADNLHYAKCFMAWFARMGPWVAFVVSLKKFKAACKDVQEVLDVYVSKALEHHAKATEKGVSLVEYEESQGRKPALLHRLTEYTTDPILLRDTVSSMMVATTESVGSVLAATFWLLARHPEEYQKLRSEVLEAIGQETPTYDQLRSIKYIRYVHNEAMRLLPPVPVNAKRANTDTWLPYGGGDDGENGIVVNKGDVVLFSSWETHRSKTTFGEDAEIFRPNRWEHMASDTPGFVPFNLGPRACPGQHFGYAQAAFFTARIAQTYGSLTSSDIKPWVEKLDFNMTNKNGVHISLREE